MMWMIIRNDTSRNYPYRQGLAWTRNWSRIWGTCDEEARMEWEIRDLQSTYMGRTADLFWPIVMKDTGLSTYAVSCSGSIQGLSKSTPSDGCAIIRLNLIIGVKNGNNFAENYHYLTCCPDQTFVPCTSRKTCLWELRTVWRYVGESCNVMNINEQWTFTFIMTKFRRAPCNKVHYGCPFNFRKLVSYYNRSDSLYAKRDLGR